ncbi:MAG: hypothetical protein R3C14_26890 [Caldilineaceae bacterium]
MDSNAIPYLHVLDGRIRAKIAAVKRSPAYASRLEQTLRLMDGVIQVKVNLTTGSVLIQFAPTVVSAEQILQELSKLCQSPSDQCTTGHTQSSHRAQPESQHQSQSFHTKLAHVVAWKAAEIATERLLLALI